MNSNLKAALAVLVGVAIGVSGNTVARARQVKPPRAYVLAEPDVTDPATFQKYAASVPGTLALYGGHYLARNGQVIPEEGEAPKRSVIIEFDSLKKAQDWYNSPEYNKIKPIRFASAKTRLFIADGVPAE